MQDQNDSLGEHPSHDPLEASNTPPSSSRCIWPQVGTFVLLAIAALYFARPLLLPLVLAVLFNLLLSPGVRALRRIGLPFPLGAAMVLLATLAALGLAAWQLAEPASDWIERAPRSLLQIQDKIRPLKRSVEQVQKATEQVEQATQVGATRPVREVKVKGQSLLQQLMAHAQEISSSRASKATWCRRWPSVAASRSTQSRFSSRSCSGDGSGAPREFCSPCLHSWP